jgi:hypothetical protein
MNFDLCDDVHDAIDRLNKIECTAMPMRPTEKTAVSSLRRFVARTVYREQSQHFTALHGFSVRGFDYRGRFDSIVTDVFEALDEHGRLYCKGSRGWHLSADADCIAEELNKTHLCVMPSHVREAQRRKDYDRQQCSCPTPTV